MTPREKAIQLVGKYTETIFDSGNTVSKPMVKQCALIAVDEILESMTVKTIADCEKQDYWQQVKTEIENL